MNANTYTPTFLYMFNTPGDQIIYHVYTYGEFYSASTEQYVHLPELSCTHIHASIYITVLLYMSMQQIQYPS